MAVRANVRRRPVDKKGEYLEEDRLGDRVDRRALVFECGLDRSRLPWSVPQVSRPVIVFFCRVGCSGEAQGVQSLLLTSDVRSCSIVGLSWA